MASAAKGAPKMSPTNFEYSAQFVPNWNSITMPVATPTANVNPERVFPSMFEPIHGSAFDITGKGIANPIGTFWSAVLLLEHLGEAPAAERLMTSIERVTADPRFHTPDLGGSARTEDVTEAVIEALRGANI